MAVAVSVVVVGVVVGGEVGVGAGLGVLVVVVIRAGFGERPVELTPRRRSPSPFSQAPTSSDKKWLAIFGQTPTWNGCKERGWVSR